jgi:uncharacterized DUF497 family protein
MIGGLEFEWSADKAQVNIRKHKVDFALAAQVLLDPTRLEEPDDSGLPGEQRWTVIGMAEGCVLFVVYTERHETLRLISARQATRREKDEYARALSP